MRIGDRIKILGQDIYGKIVRLHPSEVVIFDEDLKTELCFKITEIEGVIHEWFFKRHYKRNW